MSLGKANCLLIVLLMLAVTSQSLAAASVPCNMPLDSYDHKAMVEMDHSTHTSEGNTSSDYCCDHDISCSLSNCASSIDLSISFDILELPFQTRRTDSYDFSTTHTRSSSIYRPPIFA